MNPMLPVLFKWPERMSTRTHKYVDIHGKPIWSKTMIQKHLQLIKNRDKKLAKHFAPYALRMSSQNWNESQRVVWSKERLFQTSEEFEHYCHAWIWTHKGEVEQILRKMETVIGFQEVCRQIRQRIANGELPPPPINHMYEVEDYEQISQFAHGVVAPIIRNVEVLDEEGNATFIERNHIHIANGYYQTLN